MSTNNYYYKFCKKKSIKNLVKNKKFKEQLIYILLLQYYFCIFMKSFLFKINYLYLMEFL